MTSSNDPVSIETTHHVIELSEGCLSIDEKRFPDDCVSLSADETKAVLKLLLMNFGPKAGVELEKKQG